MDKIKPIVLKLILAVVLTATVLFFYNRESVEVIIENPPVIKDTNVAIDACINEALDGGIDKERAVNTCECFFKVTEENYPKGRVTSILMAMPNPNGDENEQALSKVIKQCMEENIPQMISEPIIDVIVEPESVIETITKP